MKILGYPDKPVSSLQNDLFSIETYINGLCQFIKNCDTPMTISIQGDWGSGKTSMMNMIREKMEEEICPVWFNTWQFSQFSFGESLAFSMMAVLLNELGCEKDSINKVLGGVLHFTKNVAVGTVDHLVGGYAADKLNSVLTPEATVDYANEIIRLKERFQIAVNKKIEKDNKSRVVVFVDDLDRLQPAKAIELLEVLKLFLDCENCVFVLAVDYEVVTMGIKQKFGEDVSKEKGRSFFDKIIQLPFKMPVAQYDIKKYVAASLMKMNIRSDENTLDLFERLIQNSIGFNPRSMKRLFNTYQLLCIISAETSSGVDESIRQRVLFAIICLQMSYENVYAYFMSSISILDAEFISILLDSEKIIEEEELVKIIANGQQDVDTYIQKVSRFMKCFTEAIQMDADNAISDEEIETLKKVLKCSSVTSVGTDTEDKSDEIDKRYKRENKQLQKEINDMIKGIVSDAAEPKEMFTWSSRSNKGEQRYADVSTYIYYRTKFGFRMTFEYYLSREDEKTITVQLRVNNTDQDMIGRFFNEMPENPLEYSVKPIKTSYQYKYDNVIQVSCTDDEAASKISKVILDAYHTLTKIMG
ncbi:MAG: hypothetical protein II331_06005 [Lachnospiraceae bacterium]|nr:hypothetical protein [Lachnospiraceae bacterium]